MNSGSRDLHALRLRRLRDRLHESRLDGVLVAHLPNIRYLCGFTGSNGLLLVEPGLATLFTDFRYETQAAEEVVAEVSVEIVANGLLEAVGKRLAEAPGGRPMGFEEGSVTVMDRRALGEACGRIVWEPAGPLVEELRARKDAFELEAIESAVGLAESSLSETMRVVTAGMSERELAAELEYRLSRAGSEGAPFPTIVAAGERTALPHARPGDRTIRERDLILLDFGATVRGYCSDLTRVFVVGRAQPWQNAVYDAVQRAVEAAVAATRARVTGRDVDAAARTVLEAERLSERFGHGTGHGVGLEVHESPSLNRRSSAVLEAGNVVTIEPGVYLPGRGGIRLEDLVVVTDGGCRRLSHVPDELPTL